MAWAWVFERLKPWVAQRLEWALLWAFAATAKRRRCGRETGRILIARTDGLGDFLLWTDAQKRLREMYPGKKLVVMLDAEKPTRELAERSPHIDEVMTVHVHRYVRFFEVFRMRRHRFDLVLQPVYGRTAFTDLLLFACRAGERITLDGNRRFLTPWEKRVADRAYDRVIPAGPRVRHELIRCGEMIRGLGDGSYRAALPRMAVQAERPSPGPAYIVVYPGGSWKEKCWPPQRFAAICDWMYERTGRTILLCGGENDAQAAAGIWERMAHRDACVVLAGKHDLCRSFALIRDASFVFGNDTGAIHMAAVCRVPAAAIVVGREIGRFFPYEVERRTGDEIFPEAIFAPLPCMGCMLEEERPCVYAQDGQERLPCIEQISVGQVQAAIQRFL